MRYGERIDGETILREGLKLDERLYEEELPERIHECTGDKRRPGLRGTVLEGFASPAGPMTRVGDLGLLAEAAGRPSLVRASHRRLASSDELRAAMPGLLREDVR